MYQILSTEKRKSDKERAFISKEYRQFCKNRKRQIEYCTPRTHTRKRSSRKINTNAKKSDNSELGINLTEIVNRALRVMRVTIHTGLTKPPFEFHHGIKPKLTNIVKDGKAYLSNWSEMTTSAPNRPKIPTDAGRDAEGDTTNYIIMARKKIISAEVQSHRKRSIWLDTASILLKRTKTNNQ